MLVGSKNAELQLVLGLRGGGEMWASLEVAEWGKGEHPGDRAVGAGEEGKKPGEEPGGQEDKRNVLKGKVHWQAEITLVRNSS